MSLESEDQEVSKRKENARDEDEILNVTSSCDACAANPCSKDHDETIST